MLSAAEITAQLPHFYGSEHFYRHSLANNIIYTDGIKWLCENAECYWLLDKIATNQLRLLKMPCYRNGEPQFWELTRIEGNKFNLVCRPDSGLPPSHSETLDYSDFPLDSIKIWVENRTIFLPSER